MRVPALYPSPAPTPLGCPQILKEPSLPTTPPRQRGRTSIIPYSLAPVNTFEAGPFVLPRPGSTRPSHRFTHPLSAAAARERAHCRGSRHRMQGGAKRCGAVFAHPFIEAADASAGSLQNAAEAKLSKRVCSPKKLRRMVPVGPFRCLAMMISATPLSGVSGL